MFTRTKMERYFGSLSFGLLEIKTGKQVQNQIVIQLAKLASVLPGEFKSPFHRSHLCIG